MLAGYSETRRDGGAYRAGHVHSAHVGAYVSYLNDSGSYVDGVVKYNRFRHGFDIRTTDLKRVDAKHRSHGLGALLRGGRVSISMAAGMSSRRLRWRGSTPAGAAMSQQWPARARRRRAFMGVARRGGGGPADEVGQWQYR